MDIMTVVLYAAGLLGLYALGYFALVPMKWVGKLLISAVLGGAALWILNCVGGIWGLHVALNPFSALIAGILGIPGVALLLVLSAVL